MTLKVLNLYAGLGGNRKLWEGVEVTAVEIDEEIAEIYGGLYPTDKVIIGDAHQYLLNHYKEFDFIWSSPPCSTHSRARWWGLSAGNYEPVYPDMTLYQEIIFLKHHVKCPWVVENVIGYYEPLIKPYNVSRHYFWSNYPIIETQFNTSFRKDEVFTMEENYGFKLDIDGDLKRKVLRNCVLPELGAFIFDSAFKLRTLTLDEYSDHELKTNV